MPLTGFGMICYNLLNKWANTQEVPYGTEEETGDPQRL